MPKLIFFDIDGTLWDNRMQIPDSTRTALRKLKENGHKYFICSGRARANIFSNDLLSLDFDGILAACGNYVELDGKVLYNRLLSDEQTEKTVRILEECHMPVVLEGPKYHWISAEGFDEDPYVEYLFREMGKYAIPLHGYEKGMELNKFSADVLEKTDYKRIREELGDIFDFLEHEGNVIEAVPKGSSKATGIAWLCDYLGVDVADTYAVGDSVNDLDMLEFAGHGIAMGNGTAPAKAAAEYITSDIHEDGIYRAMQHYGLID
jgi:Cof subfamily protein (haloacid dehalogenase superfamily)